MTEWEIKPAIWDDVERVLEAMAEQCKADYPDGLTDVVKLKMAAFMLNGDTDFVLRDGKPQFIFSVRDTDAGPVTWFVATKDFFAGGRKALRFGAAYTYAMAQQHGGLLSKVGSANPKVAKWMRAMGFQPLPGDGTVFMICP